MVSDPHIRCPVINDPAAGLADPADFDPLLARLGDAAAIEAAVDFPRGRVAPDGRVDLCKQGVGPVLAYRLASAAAASDHARHLLLGTNGLGGVGARAVADALAPGHRLETVYLGCNRIDAEGVAALADRLTDDDVVKGLWLKRNPLGDTGVARLCEALARNCTLRTLDLVNVGLTVAGVERLAGALAERPARLERLFLGGNRLGPDAVPALAALLSAGVTELYLPANRLGDNGTAGLAEAAAALPVTLGMGGNGITATGVDALADRMARWSALDLARPPSGRALGASANVVGDAGAAALAAALPGSVLRRLDLRYTGITGRGARLLLAALETHPTLAYLGLNGGVPRRMRRRAAQLAAGTRPHPDIRAIVSVYR